jgi:hypothetical protein
MKALLRADSAAVAWDPDKKNWRVRIQVGEEIIKRPYDRKLPKDAPDDDLRTAAVETAHAEGYEVNAATVSITR